LKNPQNTTKPGGRQPWDWRDEGKNFHKAHGYTPYTMMWNKTLEAEMMDEDLPREIRVLSAVRRYAWGNFSDWAVTHKPRKKETDPAPKPLTQEMLADILGIGTSQMSKIIGFLKQQSYLRENHPHMFPEERVSTLESDELSRRQVPAPGNIHSPYLRFEQDFFAKNPQLAKSLSELEERRKQYQDAARNATLELRKIKLKALAAWRDQNRETDEAA